MLMQQRVRSAPVEHSVTGDTQLPASDDQEDAHGYQNGSAAPEEPAGIYEAHYMNVSRIYRL